MSTTNQIELRKRKGRIIISNCYLDLSAFNTEAESDIMFELFSHFIPVRMETNLVTSTTEIWGYCHNFEKVKEGQEIQLYDVEISKDTNSVKFTSHQPQRPP